MGILLGTHARNAVSIAMKLRLPSSLVQAMLAACAVVISSTTPAFADVPEGYDPTNITSSWQLRPYTETDYTAFIIGADITNNEYTMMGSHQYWGDQTLRSHELTFSGIENSSSDGGALKADDELIAEFFKKLQFANNYAYGAGAIRAYYGDVTMSNNGSVAFSENFAHYGPGGAIYSWKGCVTMSDNGSVAFSENHSAGGFSGGAIKADSVTMSNNGSVVFNGNYTTDYFSEGGAIFVDRGSLIMSDNGSVEFSGNHAFNEGGAIGGRATVCFSRNDTVTFSGNYSPERGGAIEAISVTMSDNGNVEFKGNHTSDITTVDFTTEAGAIRANSVALAGNESVVFSENYADDGGAINAGTVTVEDNRIVTFSENHAYEGGAINASSVSMTGNGTMLFNGNHAHAVAAIRGVSSLTMTSNGSVEFSGNYSDSGGVISARSVTMTGNGSMLFSENYFSGNYAASGVIDASSICFSENGTVTFSGNRTNAIDAGYTGAVVVMTGNESVTFSGNSSDDYDHSGAMRGGENSSLTLSGNGCVTFSENHTSDGYGSAICGKENSSITLSDNESVEFSMNTAGRDGGAIRSGEKSTLTLSGNGCVTFSGNGTSQFGGAINTSGVTMTDNRQVYFSWNKASRGGGAIYSNNGNLNIAGTGYLEFKGNTVGCSNTHAYGGAIYASDSGVNLTGNTEVEFIGNCAQTTASGCFAQGGAIYSWGDTTNLSDNVTLAFYQNFTSDTDGGYYAARGGALSASALKIEGNSYVIFNENYAQANTSSPQGGAIYAPTCDLTNNGSVKFERNHVASATDLLYGGGGAIYSYGKLNIAGNDHVEFGGNYEKLCGANPATYRLRSVYMAGSELILAAGENQDIVFYDPICVENRSGNATVSYNADYLDKYNVQQKSTGDIIFSGARAAQYLAGLKSDYTPQELTDSLTTEVYAETNLYGGMLRIEDGAIYKGNGINVAEDSNATLRLADGTLDQAGYSVLLNDTTMLDLAGENSITASSLQMLDGSTLSFNIGAAEGALLNLDATLMTGDIHVTVGGDLTKEHALLQLADVSRFDFTQWNSGQVSVSGTDYEHLIWKDGVLSYKPWESTHTDVKEDTEVDDFGGKEGVDIDGGGHSLTVKHPVDLVQLAMKNGVVRLEGEDNNVVRITLTEDGTLELAAGAGLKVGNIVSMVANGSADLVISGDIEINDIKAYGKPGNKGTLSYVEMKTEGDYTIENMSVSGSLIDIGEGTTMYMVNVDISADTRITDDAAWLDMVATKAWLTKDNTVSTGRYSTDADTTLYLCGDTAKSITLAAGTDIVELTSEMFDTVTMTGTDLWLDMTKIAGLMPNTDYITLQFKNLENALVDVENLKVYATIDGETYRQAYTTTDHGTTTTLYFALPEPTTSTLSLLALAALAARRRRK